MYAFAAGPMMVPRQKFSNCRMGAAIIDETILETYPRIASSSFCTSCRAELKRYLCCWIPIWLVLLQERSVFVHAPPRSAAEFRNLRGELAFDVQVRLAAGVP